MKVALFSPMPPERSGIADYAALLLPALRARCEIVTVKRGAKKPPRGTDLSVYHIGNNPEAHGWIVDALRRTPGLVVLHDFVLHHLVSGITLGRGDGRAYLDALERDGGLVARLLGYAVMEKRIPPLWENRPEDFPLTGEVLRLATGLIVHSRYVRDRARAVGYEGPIWIVPHPAFPVPEVAAADLGGDPLFATFGNVNASKRIPQLLEAFARVRREHGASTLLLVGAVSPGFDLDRRLQRLGLDGAGLVREGYVDERRLWELMLAADVHVSLRSPTMGETSGTAIRALSLGKPLIVSDVGWFSELPDDVALKVPVDEHEVATLAAALELLATRPDVRRAMGAAAHELARRDHGLERVAELYVSAFEQAAGGERGPRRGADGGERGRGGRRDRAGVRRGARVSVEACRGRPWCLTGSVGSEPSPPGPGFSRSSSSRLCSGPGSPAACSAPSSWSTSSSTPSSRRASPAISRSPSVVSQTTGYGVVYPAVIAPAYAVFGRVPDAYAAIKTINSLAMSLAAIPAYFIARRVVGQGLALAAAVLAVAVPSMVYTAVVMTENAFYPLFLLAALALVALLERPATIRYVAFFATLGTGVPHADAGRRDRGGGGHRPGPDRAVDAEGDAGDAPLRTSGSTSSSPPAESSAS